VSDTQWALLCAEFGFADLAGDPRLASNNDRVRARDWLLPLLRERFAPFTRRRTGARFERIGLPYAPITRPQDLFDDPHLQATGGLAPVTCRPTPAAPAAPVDTRAPLLPLTLDGQRLPLRSAAAGRRRAHPRCCSNWAMVGLPAAAPADQRAEAPPPA
jgi:hypothetical protein